MTQMVRFLSRYMNADEKTADIVCRTATALIPTSRPTIGASGDVQSSVSPTAIVLYEVELESMIVLRETNWTHIQWSSVNGEVGHNLVVWKIFYEGNNVRFLV